MPEILVRIHPGTLPPDDWDLAEQAARRLLAETDRDGAEVSVLLTDDASIHQLNREWRGIDRPTDVLSWPQESMSGPDDLVADLAVLGDVAISLDTARRQAAARAWSESEEVALLLVHGILHLLGHEDDTEAGADAMRAIETRILGRPLEKTASANPTQGKMPV